MKTITNATWTNPPHVRCLWLLLAIVALAVTPESAWATDQVPFKGKAEGAVVSVSPDPEGVVMTIFAEGNATHLGRFSRAEEVLFDPITGTFAGVFVLTAAKGDQLFGVVEGGFISPTTAIGTNTFSGGTGRFANATGAYDFVATSPDLIHLTAEFEGTLSSVGAQ